MMRGPFVNLNKREIVTEDDNYLSNYDISHLKIDKIL